MGFRNDLELISSWIKPNSKVLDLGCGDGYLLKMLAEKKNIKGLGVDNDINKIKLALKKNVNVLQLDLDTGLETFNTQSFDYVVLAQSLQVVKNPDKLIKEMLNIGEEIIVSFPNMGHWRPRLQLFLKGMMPVTDTLPFKWFNTPNIHLCTISDFIGFCEEHNLRISQRVIVSKNQKSSLLIKLFPNLFGEVATFRLR